MSFPTLVKTWQLVPNHTVSAQANATIQSQNLISQIVTLMTGFGSNPWTAVQSSDAGNNGAASAASGGVGAGNRWSNATTDNTVKPNNCGVNFATAGNRHSWIVLQQTGLGTNVQICIDLNGTGISLDIVVSWNAGFSGGSATNRPTATDELLLFTGIWGSELAVQHQIHAWQSTDGQCTRIMVWRGGTNLCTFWQFDRLQNPASGWTLPIFIQTLTAPTAICTQLSALTLGQTCVMVSGVSGGRVGIGGFTYETYAALGTNGMLSATGIGTIVNSFSGVWPVFPINVAAGPPVSSVYAGVAGRMGGVYDMWWCPSGVASADTFPNNASVRSYAAFGGIVLPWTGDSTVPLLT